MKNVLRKLTCLLLITVLSAGLFGCASKEVRENYRQGEHALREGRYADAVGYFGPLEGYRKSGQYLTDAYDRAMALYEGGQYRDAAEIFGALAVYEIQDAALYARVTGAYACLYALDAAGAYALLESTDQTHDAVAAAYAALELFCFEDTTLIRPEYVALELAEGRVIPEISNISADRYLDEILYTMNQNATDSVYDQYREYCQAAFPESFTDESESYFTFRIDDATYYVCNHFALYGGLVIKLPRY